MAASKGFGVNRDVDVFAAFQTFLIGETAERATRTTAWDALPGGNPIADLQATFDNYQDGIKDLFDAFQALLGESINVVSEFFRNAFDAFQVILGGGGTVSDGVAQGARLDIAMDGAIEEGGDAVKCILSGTEEIAKIIGVEIAREAAGPGESISFDSSVTTLVEEVTLQIEDRSFAECMIPFALQTTGEESVPAVSAIKKSPARGILGGVRASVYIDGPKKIRILNGAITYDSDQLEVDGFHFTVTDDKWEMAGVHIVGTFHWDPGNPENLAYRNRGRCIFNENGKANMIKSDYGWMFAPYPDYGIQQGQDLTDSIGVGESGSPVLQNNANNKKEDTAPKAQYWSPHQIIEYLKTTCFEPNVKIKDAVKKFPMYNTLPFTKVFWPQGLGSSLLIDGAIDRDDAQTIAGIKDGDREGNSKAKIVHMDLTSMDLESALKRVVESSGAYGIYMKPMTTKSMLTIRPTRYRKMHLMEGTRKAVIRRVGDYGDADLPKVFSGSIDRDYENTYSSVYVLGDVVFCDVKIEFDPTTPVGGKFEWSDDEETWNLFNMRPVFSPEHINMFRNYVNGDSGSPVLRTPQAFKDAISLMPYTFNAYRINKDAPDPIGGDFLKTTKYEGFPDLKVPPPILDHLLTWSVEAGNGSLRRLLPLPINVEVRKYLGVDGAGVALFGDYIPLGKLDGLEIDDQGTIYLPGLREAALAGVDRGTWVGSVFDPKGTIDAAQNFMQARPIRMTVAVAYDHRLGICMAMPNAIANFKSKDNALNHLQMNDPNWEANSLASDFSRQYVADTGDSYREYFRLGTAEVVPETVELSPLNDGTSEVDPLQNLLGKVGQDARLGVGDSKALLTDEEKCRTHAQRRLAAVGRPNRTGNLLFNQFVLWEPGTVIHSLATQGGAKDEVYRIDSLLFKIKYNYEKQNTEMDLR